MGDDALMPLRLFRIRRSRVGIAASVDHRHGDVRRHHACIPLYLQIVQGASPTKSGLLMLPLVVGMMSASIISGQITSRTGRYRIFPIIGSALLVAGAAACCRRSPPTRLLLVTAVDVRCSATGWATACRRSCWPCRTPCRPRDIGVATSSATFFRQIGGTLGVAVFLSMLFGSVGANIKGAILAESQTPAFQQAVQTAAQSSDPLDRQVADAFLHPTPGGGVLAQVQNDSSIVQQMPPTLAHPFKVGFAESMDTVFLLRRLRRGPGLPGPAADAQGRAPGDLGERRRTLRGRADRPGGRPGLTRLGAKRHRNRVESAQRDVEITPSRHVPTRRALRDGSVVPRWEAAPRQRLGP